MDLGDRNRELACIYIFLELIDPDKPAITQMTLDPRCREIIRNLKFHSLSSVENRGLSNFCIFFLEASGTNNRLRYRRFIRVALFKIKD